MTRWDRRLDWTLVVVAGALIAIGLLNLYSALYLWGEPGYLKLFWSQLFSVLIGLVFLLLIARFDYRLFDKFAYPLYVISLVLLAAVLIFGKEVAGHRSWLSIGGVSLQPSEFAKLSVLIVLAKFFSDNPHPEGYDLFELIKPGILAAVPIGFILLEHDFGSAIFFVLLFMSIAWFAKIKTRAVFLILAIGVLASVFMFYFTLSDYQRARFTTFVNPSWDVKGSGYHLLQSRIAVGSGRMFGKGYLKGSINKLRFLPEKHTDFVFPVLAEEWGFAGCLVTLGLYMALLLIGVDIARHARDRFGVFLSVGVISYLFWQIVINIGGVLGMMPLTGVTLPFLSYGGSSMVSVMCAIGMLFSVSRRRFVF